MSLPIGNKIGLGSALITGVLFICGFAGYYGVSHVVKDLDYITGPAWNSADGAMEGTIEIEAQAILVGRLINGTAKPADIDSKLQTAISRAEEAFGRLVAANIVDRELLTKMERHLALFNQTRGALLNDYTNLNNDPNFSIEQIRKPQQAFLKAQDELLTHLVKVEEAADGAVESRLDEVAANKTRAIGIIAVTVVLGVLISIGNYLFSLNSIATPLKEMAARMRDIATGNGDLTARIAVKGDDEIADVANNFNLITSKTQNMIRQIVDTATELSSSADELQSVATHSQSSLFRQKSDIDQMAAAMHEMTATVQEVARNAAQAATAAEQTNREAASGKSVVSKTIRVIQDHASEVGVAASVIQKLEKDSENIGSVLDVIKGIAEQTNLLALNAAIEAARAGEQGRGFAVVADEVRTLASRTQESTREIEQMIVNLQNGASNAVAAMNKGQGQAEESAEHARQAGQSLDAIANSIATISDMNHQIATAVEEQTAVATEINRNVCGVSDAAHEVTTGSDQSVRASQRVANLSSQLLTISQQFRV